MFIYNSFHYTENDPKSDLKVFVQTLMWYASDRITIPNFLLAAGKKKKKKKSRKIIEYIHKCKMLKMAQEQNSRYGIPWTLF